MSRPTHLQQELLAEFLGENPGLAKGLLRTAHAKQDIKQKWIEVSIKLNSLGGAQKDGKGWAKYWADKKCALKKICAQHRQSMTRTGGGPPEAVPPLTFIEKKLVDVMGGIEFATGDTHVALNPFPGRSYIPTSINSTHNTTGDTHLALNPFPGQSNIPISINSTPSVSQNITPNQVVVEGNSSAQQTLPSTIDSEMQSNNLVTDNPELHVPQRDRSPLRTRSRSRQPTRSNAGTLNEDRRLFAAIEKDRVEAEMITANALRQAVDSIESVATAINNLSASIIEAAQIIAQAMSSNTQ